MRRPWPASAPCAIKKTPKWCMAGVERSERKVFCGTSAGRTRFLFKKASTLPLWGVSQREVRETAKRFSRPVAHREGGFCEPLAHVRGPVPGLSIRAPGSSLSLVLIKPPAHVRAGGCAWNFLRPRTLYFTGPALDFCEFSLNFPCIFGKIGTRKQPLSQIF